MVNTKRKVENKFKGDCSYDPVRVGNQMADTAALLMAIAKHREVHAVIEQPNHSVMFKYLARHLVSVGRHSATCARCAYAPEPYGQRALKRFRFVGTGAWVEQLATKCSCPGSTHKSLANVSVKDGRRTVTGKDEELKASAAYPPALGIAIVQAWLGSCMVPHAAAVVPRAATEPKFNECRARSSPCSLGSWSVQGPWSKRGSSSTKDHHPGNRGQKRRWQELDDSDASEGQAPSDWRMLSP